MDNNHELTRQCACCGLEKPLTQFYKDRRKKNDLGIYCKSCHAEKWAKYSAKKREPLRAAGREYYRDNREQVIARLKKDRDENLDEYRQREQLAKERARRERPEAMRAYAKRYYAKNRLKICLRNRLTRAFRAYSEKGKTRSSDEYGIDYQAIINYLGARPDDNREWHIDHIRPLASFDFDDPGQVREAFAPENHQWLEAFENRSKGGRL